jgi:hypothetical protein
MVRRGRISAWVFFVYLAGAISTQDTPASAEESATSWAFESYPDPINRGGRIASARITQPAPNGERAVDAWVRCWTATRRLDARFEIQGRNSELTGDVTWQVDRSPVRGAHWRVSPSGQSVVVPESELPALLRSLRAGRELQLKLRDEQGAELPLTVTLRGSSRAIGGVADACRMAGSGTR